MSMTDGKTFTITLPKVGVGLQGGTLALVVWLGGQADAFVGQLTEGMDSLSDRMSAVEGMLGNVGIDETARTGVSEVKEKNLEQDGTLANFEQRLQALEKCKVDKRKCDT